MKKITYMEGLRSKAQTSTQIRKIEQKRVETSILADEHEDEWGYTEPLIQDCVPTMQTDLSFAQDDFSTTWGKENLSSKLKDPFNTNSSNK